jgi:hypothetical protein
MRDDDFRFFIKNMGEATTRIPVAPSALERWKGVLPDRLLTCWSDEGWSGYADGLFWIVDPGEYEDLVTLWLRDTPLAEVDCFHVIGRTAFGTLYTWGERTGNSLTIACPIHALVAIPADLQRSVDDPDRQIRAFFITRRKTFDMQDEREQPLFARALQRLGPLGSDEMYGFEPALVAGGRMLVETLAKVDLQAHLTILRQLAPPTVPFASVRVDL